MGFFGVLTDEPERGFEVGRFDLNLWCLPRRFRRYAFFCDFGIELTAQTSVQQLSVAAPFQSTATVSDLADLLRRDRIATLIFGDPVSILDRGKYIENQIKDEKLRICHIDLNASSLNKTQSNRNFSLWNLRLSQAITPGEKSYLRFRLEVRSLGRFWVWQPSRGGGRAAVADVRVNDHRQTAALKNAHDYEERLVRIKRLNCFIMLPVDFEYRLCSPAVQHLRLLEAEVWSDYLPDKSAKHKLLVHYWRKQDVAENSEFWGLLNVRSAPPRVRWGSVAIAIVTAVVVGLLLKPPEAVSDILAALEEMWAALMGQLSPWLLAIGGAFALIGGWLFNNLDSARKLWSYLAKLCSESWPCRK